MRRPFFLNKINKDRSGGYLDISISLFSKSASSFRRSARRLLSLSFLRETSDRVGFLSLSVVASARAAVKVTMMCIFFIQKIPLFFFVRRNDVSTLFLQEDLSIVFRVWNNSFEKKRGKHRSTKTHARALSTHGKERKRDSHEPCLALLLLLLLPPLLLLLPMLEK